jgi:hypothetical protein
MREVLNDNPRAPPPSPGPGSLPMTNVLFLLHLMSVVIVFTATP